MQDAKSFLIFRNVESTYYKNRLVLVGGRDEATQLWKLPINPTKNPNDASTTIANLDLHVMTKQKRAHTANALYTLPYKQNQLKYMHQAFLSAGTNAY